MNAKEVAELWEPLVDVIGRPEGLSLMTEDDMNRMNESSAAYMDGLAQRCFEQGDVWGWESNTRAAESYRNTGSRMDWLPVWVTPSRIPGMRSNLTPEQARAMWRDHAVNFLRDHMLSLFPADERDRETGHFVELDHDLDEGDRRHFNGPTLDHALAAACRAVGEDDK